VRKLPHQLVASFRATLEETREADLLLHVIDASHPQWEEQRDVVEEVLAEIGAGETPSLLVYNKTDAMEPARSTRCASGRERGRARGLRLGGRGRRARAAAHGARRRGGA
jgi:GTP-binding protein HflX